MHILMYQIYDTMTQLYRMNGPTRLHDAHTDVCEINMQFRQVDRGMDQMSCQGQSR
jgi:hypothetical protein